MKKKISVTYDHILKGIPGSAFSCPVALAAQDAGLHTPRVGPTRISFRQKDSEDGFQTLYRELPPEARSFIRAVDNNHLSKEELLPVERKTIKKKEVLIHKPFTFEIEV